MLTSLQPDEVQLLVSPPTKASGNRLQEHILSFEALASRIQLTQLCEETYFQYHVTAGKKYNIRLDGDDGWRTITPLCREYTQGFCIWDFHCLEHGNKFVHKVVMTSK